MKNRLTLIWCYKLINKIKLSKENWTFNLTFIITFNMVYNSLIRIGQTTGMVTCIYIYWNNTWKKEKTHDPKHFNQNCFFKVLRN